jgi:transcriptional regulator with XRE-family HTH domain
MTKAKFSIRKLASETGIDRGTITKWLEGRNPQSKTEALAIIAEHPRAPTDSTPPFKLDMALLGHTLEHYVEHSKLCVRMIGILADAAAAIDAAVARGDLGLTEDQAKRLLVMLGEPWEAAKRLLPADLLEAAEKEGA